MNAPHTAEPTRSEPARRSISQQPHDHKPSQRTRVHKVLLLTDSIISRFDPDKFLASHPEGTRIEITKASVMKLFNIDFTNHLGIYDTVIISCGVNDFKYRYTPAKIAQTLARGVAQIPSTTNVIFRALTPTKFNPQNELIFFCLWRAVYLK